MTGRAAQRVAASRAAIAREWIADAAPAHEARAAPAASPWHVVADWAMHAAGAREGAPPLRAGLRLACSLTEAAVSPLAQRHPWALVGVAALGGALLVSARPWRWRMPPSLLGRLLTQAAWGAVAGQVLGRPAGRSDEPASRA